MATRRTPKPKTAVQTAIGFCRVHMGRGAFAPFTGQDMSAWSAFCYVMELWCRGDHVGRDRALLAMAALLRAAQCKEDIHRMFLQAIPAIGDWCHAREIWPIITGPIADMPRLGDGAGSRLRGGDWSDVDLWAPVGMHRDPLAPAVRS